MSMTWEQAVQWLRDQPEQQELVKACYFDDPLIEAAQRFWASAEWRAMAAELPKRAGAALDLGAGRGISSYALARDGWNVTALEPDPSDLVGAGAIRELARQAGLNIGIVGDYAEGLPFPDDSFDLVCARQVLHHARDLRQTCREIYRVLKPRGHMLATREHVISHPQDLQAFLDSHPLHHHYGGENAFLLPDYVSAITGAGMTLSKVLAPFDSPINYFPMTERQLYDYIRAALAGAIGGRLANLAAPCGSLRERVALSAVRRLMNRRNRVPGRLYSFIAVKPDHV